MRFSFVDGGGFQNFMKVVSMVADEVTLQLSSDGLRCQVVAKNAVSMYDVLFKPSYFEIFEVDGVDYIKIVPEDISNILKTVGKDESVLFDVEDDTLHVIIDGERRRCFNISLLEDFDDFRTFPSFPFEVESQPVLDELLSIIKDLELMGCPEIILKAQDNLTCTGVNEYKGSVKCDISSCTGEGKAVYNLNTFHEVIGFKNFHEVKLKFSSDNPVMFYFTDEAGTVELTTMLAPIIKNE